MVAGSPGPTVVPLPESSGDASPPGSTTDGVVPAIGGESSAASVRRNPSGRPTSGADGVADSSRGSGASAGSSTGRQSTPPSKRGSWRQAARSSNVTSI